MRETAKWLIVTFGAVANAFILAGIGLGNLAKVTGSRRAWALAAVAAAVLAVLLAVVSASRVLTAGQVTYSDLIGASRSRKALRKAMGGKTDLYPGYATIDEFIADMTDAANQQITAARPLFAGTGGDSERATYERANEKVRILRPLGERLLLVAEFVDVRRQLVISRVFSSASFVLLAIAAVVFAIATKGVTDASAKGSTAPTTNAQTTPTTHTTMTTQTTSAGHTTPTTHTTMTTQTTSAGHTTPTTHATVATQTTSAGHTTPTTHATVTTQTTSLGETTTRSAETARTTPSGPTTATSSSPTTLPMTP